MDYEVVFSARKTLAIKIENGAVIVKAPKGMSKKEIKSIVLKHSGWIEKAAFSSSHQSR